MTFYHDPVTPRITHLPETGWKKEFVKEGILIPFAQFKSTIASISNTAILSEDYCLALLKLCYDQYEYIKFLWGYTHPCFQVANTKIIQRLVELVVYETIDDQIELQKILPMGTYIIDPNTQKEAYQKFIASSWRHNQLPSL